FPRGGAWTMGPGMSMGMQMRAEQKQMLILAPRMIQSMEILQLPIMALQERIQQELQENPVLELKDSPPEGEESASGEAEGLAETAAAEDGQASDDTAKELVIDEKGGGEDDFDRLLQINQDWADHFNEEHRPSSGRLDEESDKKHDFEQNMASRPQSLQDYLSDQLAFLDATPEQLRLVRFLLTHIDENGYLSTPLETIGGSYDQAVTLEQLEEALRMLQKLDPRGVGARDLRECLLLQLTAETPHRDIVRVLIQHHLE